MYSNGSVDFILVTLNKLLRVGNVCPFTGIAHSEANNIIAKCFCICDWFLLKQKSAYKY